MKRRDFVKASLALTGGIPLLGMNAIPFTTTTSDPLYTISLSQWSLHRALFDGKLDNLEFVRETRETYDISAVEYVNQFFKDKAEDTEYIMEMKRRAEDAGVENLLIMVDGEGWIGHPDPQERTESIENHYKWVEAAKRLGCHSIRVNARSEGTYTEQMKRAADGLRRLVEFAELYGINVIVENHGGLSSNGKWLSSVMEMVDHPGCGTFPDFGNFRISRERSYDTVKGVKELMPYAKAVSAKSYDFDKEGNETRLDYPALMEVVVNAGYHSYVSVEYEGGRLSEPDGIRATRDLLLRLRDSLVTG